MPKKLFIGGPNDGEWHDVEDVRREIILRKIILRQRPITYNPIAPSTSYTSSVYTRETIRAGNDEVDFYVLYGTRPIDAIESLIRNYRPR